MFTKKHMIELARIVRGLPTENVEWLGDQIGQMLANSNPQFSWERWENAWQAGLLQARHNTRWHREDT